MQWSQTAHKSFTIFVLIVFIHLIQVICVHSKKSYSAKEQDALEKLRPMVTDALYRDYMQDDMYLIQWLRYTYLDIAKANSLIRKAHEWRKQFRIEEMINEDWSGFEKAFPYTPIGHDMEGRPILSFVYGATWDVRKAVLQGKGSKLTNYMTVQLEKHAIRARETFNVTVSTATGSRDVPDMVQIYDMNGYTHRQNGCLGCIPLVLTYATDKDKYYVYATNRILFINSPRIFENVVGLIRRAVSQRTNEIFKVFDHDKQKWGQHLLSFISPDQLSREYGGKRV